MYTVQYTHRSVSEKDQSGRIVPQSIQSARLSAQSPELGPLPPHPQASVAPPFGTKGGHTRLRGRGWADPIPTKGETLW
jgi:hypothetical protein